MRVFLRWISDQIYAYQAKARPLKLEPAKRLLESPESKDSILSAFARLPEETKTLVRYHSRGYDRMEDMAAAYRLAADSNSPEDHFLTLYDADGSLMWQWCKAFVESYSPNTKSTESNRIDALIPIGYTIPRDKGLEHVLQFDPDVMCLGAAHAGARDRGAPMTQRIWLHALLSVDHTVHHKGYVLNMSVRELIMRLYGTSARYKPGRHWPKLRAALEQLEHEHVTYRRSSGTIDRMPAVYGTVLPKRGLLDDRISLAILTFYEHHRRRGVILDRKLITHAGLRSAATLRIALGLSASWSVPGITRVPIWETKRQERRRRKRSEDEAKMFVQAGKTKRNHALSRYPVISNELLAYWCYPRGTARRRDYVLKESEARLDWLVGTGLVSTCYVDGARRVIPGPDWSGWSKAALSEASGDRGIPRDPVPANRSADRDLHPRSGSDVLDSAANT